MPISGAQGSRFGPGQVLINALVPANSGLTIDWYADSSGGSVLLGGLSTLSFTTPSISSTTNYFAEAKNSATGCVSSSRLLVPAIINIVSSIINVNPDDLLKVKVYPNPSNGIYNVQLNSIGDDQVIIKVLDIQGKNIKELKTRHDDIKIIAWDLSPGTYILEISQGKKKNSLKIIKN